MAYVAVTEYGAEMMFHNKPTRQKAGGKGYDYWQDDEVYWEVRGYTTCAKDYAISLPKGTIKKLIGREMTWEDEPVKID
jgi:hypothetical protein